MKLFYLNVLLLLCSFLGAAAQTTTLTFSTGPDWTDALLLKSLKSTEAYMATTNYNTYPRIASTAWTHSGSQISYRTLLKFDLSSIPEGTTVQSATLYFYSDPANTSGEISNHALSGSNAFYLQKVTQAWTPSTVTWNTQPTTSTTGRVWVGPSTSATENITVNLTTLVQDMINSPATNYGLMMKLENEVYYRSRSYASTDHANSALHPKLVVTLSTPVTVSNEWFNTIGLIFQDLDRTPVTTGLLADYGMYLANVNKFNGIRSDTNHVVYEEWQALYTTLFSSQFNNNTTLTQPETVFDQVEDVAVQNTGHEMLVGMHYRYERIRADAVTSNLLSVENNKLYDVPNRTQSPYEMADCFAIAPKYEVLDGATHSFLFKPELFYNNTGKAISAIQVDADDGLDYQPLVFNTPRTVNYSTEGEKIFRFKIMYTDNSVFESHSKVQVQNITTATPVARLASTVAPPFLFTGTQTFQGPGESQPKAGKALITIAYANADQVLRKPFIVVEGFDPWKIINPDKPGKNYSFEKFVNGDPESGNRGLTRQIDYNGYATLGDAIEGEGFDIVFVDFDNGTDYIERNALMVEDLIKKINTDKVAINGVKEKNVVLGASMGGMVARYALRHMEQESGTASHDTRLFMSFDTGHQGVNVPLGLQALITNYAGRKINVGLLGGPPVTLDFKTLYPALGRAYTLLNSPAARQMLYYSVTGLGNTMIYNNSVHDDFYRSYSQMGWPRLGGISTAAIASGSECGTDQGFAPYTALVETHSVNFKYRFLRTYTKVNTLPNQTSQRIYYNKTWVRFYILWAIEVNITLFESEFYSRPSILPLDNAPGGVQDMEKWGKLPFKPNQNLFCFVPIFSALDIGGGQQPITYNEVFKAYSPAAPPISPYDVRAANFFSNPTEAGITNELHVQITKKNAIWLFQEMTEGSAFSSCSAACFGGSVQPDISGPGIICTTGATLTLNNPPLGSYTWNVSQNLLITSGQGTPSITVKATTSSSTGNGSVYLTNAGCQTESTPAKSVWVGKPVFQQSLNGPSILTVGTSGLYTTTPAGGATGSYIWEIPSGWRLVSSGVSSTQISGRVEAGTTGLHTIDLRVANNCGTGMTYTYVTGESSGGGGGCLASVSVSPNPANGDITVNIIYPPPCEPCSPCINGVDYTTEADYALYDMQSNNVRMGKTTNQKINTSGLRSGVYILKMMLNDLAYSTNVIVE